MQKKPMLWAIFGGACFGHNNCTAASYVAVLLDDYWHSFADLHYLRITYLEGFYEDFRCENAKAASCCFKEIRA